MRNRILLIALTVSLAIAGYTFRAAWRPPEPAAQRERALGMLDGAPIGPRRFVDLDALARMRPQTVGSREIIAPDAIMFDARIVGAAEVIETRYLHTALKIMNVEPPLEITHRMFIETAGGLIMPVYAWDPVADEFTPTRALVRLVGYHVYTYGKGPAIVVDGRV